MAMKLSVLLPTRNRLELLTSAIETVRRQSVRDWEIVIADNDSDQDIRGHVESLADERIRYHRTDRFIPVTENWNAALERSTGDYFVMLGDDDGLLPGYIAAIEQLVERFDAPDVIYTSALLLTFPSVVIEHPDGFLMDYGLAPFLHDVSEPYVLGRDIALAMVQGAMDFRLTFGFNAQFLVVSRRFVESLAAHGPFYQSPFPDYYSSNVAMLKARSVLVEPRARVVIGISPKSYGFYTTNKRDEEGRAFLDAGDAKATPGLERVLLPGSNINIGWLASMEAIAREYGAEYGLKVNHARSAACRSHMSTSSICRGGPARRRSPTSRRSCGPRSGRRRSPLVAVAGSCPCACGGWRTTSSSERWASFPAGTPRETRADSGRSSTCTTRTCEHGHGASPGGGQRGRRRAAGRSASSSSGKARVANRTAA